MPALNSCQYHSVQLQKRAVSHMCMRVCVCVCVRVKSSPLFVSKAYHSISLKLSTLQITHGLDPSDFSSGLSTWKECSMVSPARPCGNPWAWEIPLAETRALSSAVKVGRCGHKDCANLNWLVMAVWNWSSIPSRTLEMKRAWNHQPVTLGGHQVGRVKNDRTWSRKPPSPSQHGN